MWTDLWCTCTPGLGSRRRNVGETNVSACLSRGEKKKIVHVATTNDETVGARGRARKRCDSYGPFLGAPLSDPFARRQKNSGPNEVGFSTGPTVRSFSRRRENLARRCHSFLIYRHEFFCARIFCFAIF